MKTIIQIEEGGQSTPPSICRLCIQRDSEIVDIFELNNLSLPNKIFQCTSILIQEIDVLPTTLCSDCLKQIEIIHDFRENCIENQRLLRDSMESFVINDYLDEESVDLEEIFVKAEQSESMIESPSPVDEDNFNSINSSESQPPVKVLVPERTETSVKPVKKRKYKKPLLPCDTCGQMMNRSRLEVHKNLHNGINPYQCDVSNCGKSFNDKNRLQGHKRDYHSGKIFECKICGKTYNVQNSLHSHQLLHLTPRYECSFCGRKYKTTSCLKVHMRTHTGEKPYNCPHCEKVFAKRHNLKTHIRSHTHEKPYKCPHCDQCFGYSYMIRKHIKKFHKNVII